MIPPKTRREWRTLLTEDKQYPFKFLALKFFMNRLKMELKNDKSPASVERCAAELHAFAVKHEKFAGPDLALVFK